MSAILDYINSYATNQWFGFVIGIVGILIGLISVLIAIHERKVKLPSYSIYRKNIFTNMLENKNEPLAIFYADKRIESLTVTKILFWNAGSNTIDNNDIANADPLMVHVKGGYEILDPPKILQDNPANRFKFYLAEDQSSITLSFDFLDKGDGAVIQFFHTGNETTDIEVSGKIKGVDKLKLIEFSGKTQICWYSSYLLFIILIETQIEMLSSNIISFIHLFLLISIFYVFYRIYPHYKIKIPGKFIEKFTKEP